MSFMAFFVADMVDDSPGRQIRLLTADGLPPNSAQARKKKMSVAKACVSTFKAFIATGILFMPQAMTNAGWGCSVDVIFLRNFNGGNFAAGSMPPASQRLVSAAGPKGLWCLWLFLDCWAGCLFPILFLRIVLHFHQHHNSESLCGSWDGAT